MIIEIIISITFTVIIAIIFAIAFVISGIFCVFSRIFDLGDIKQGWWGKNYILLLPCVDESIYFCCMRVQVNRICCLSRKSVIF